MTEYITEALNFVGLTPEDSNNNKDMLPSNPIKVGKNGIDDFKKELENNESLSNVIGPSQSGEGSSLDSPKSSLKTGNQVKFEEGFTLPSRSQEKIRRSGSMFVRISDTIVDQERMAEFEKLEKDNRESLNNMDEERGQNDQTEEVIDKIQNEMNAHENQAVDDSSQLDEKDNVESETPLPQNDAESLTSQVPTTVRGENGGVGPKKEILTHTSTIPVRTVKSPKYDNTRNSIQKATNRSRHVLTVEVHGRKVVPSRDKSPYACKIIEVPPDQSSKSRSKKKIWVCQRDHKLLEDQLQGHKKQKIEEDKVKNEIDNWLIENPLFANPLFADKHDQHHTRSSLLMAEPIPIKMWPNFQNAHQKTVETQTYPALATDHDLTWYNSQSDLTSKSSFQKVHPVEARQNYSSTPTPQGSSTEINKLANNYDATTALEDMAQRVEAGIFGASEACNVLIHTVFKDSLGNPASLERVMESKEFNDFLQSSNEITALDKSSEILDACSKLITEYLDAIKSSGVGFPSNTNFAKKSSEVVCVTSRKNITLDALQKKYASHAKIWSFVPPSSPEKFQLALYLNPETGEIMQTITCQDHIFRTRYSTSPLESQIRNIISASREQVGLPAFIKPECLLDTIVRCSSFVVTRLTKAKALISRCSTKLSKYFQEIAKSKYAVNTTKLNKLDRLRTNVQQLNILTGIIYQMSKEMSNACSKIQSGIWNSMYVQDALRFPRIPGFPNPKINKECQIPSATKIPIQEAMNQLTEGIRSIDYTIRLGQFSLETLRFGVKLGKEHKKLFKNYLEGVKSLGSEKDVDYGSLLMTLLCSTEMINHFEDVMPSVDKFVRAAILTHLGKINWETAELLGIVKRMETDSHILAMRTTFKLRELKNRYKQEYGENI